ncbi:hypothetical protein [Desulfobotulus mexicanus]|uniref:Uncharacterized protein n=1 Tax=Desulfobotulus mexicanus TaxID=2586642 RepID=A0A5S5MF99_9BACT|nr:hypothetical protein [Desulfobotulus mexicanus]TYT74403.1 hypothetical protein FIM25_10610 [Desulfobotulus mexicanus]
MTFRESLLKKIDLDRLALRIKRSLSPDAEKLDKDCLRLLMAESAYLPRTLRDMEIYVLEEAGSLPDIVVADRGLGRYRSSLEDVAMRKSPTIKEMISFTNARKILSDADVLVSSKTETLDYIHSHCLERLDLSFTLKDIEAIADEGALALEIRDGEGVKTALMLFAELLGLSQGPAAWREPGWLLYGLQEKEGEKRAVCGLTAFCVHDFRIFRISGPLVLGLEETESMVKKLFTGKKKGDQEGKVVFTALLEAFSAYKPKKSGGNL